MTANSIQLIIGDYSGFYNQQIRRLLDIGIDLRNQPISHLAYRTETINEYLIIRRKLEPHCSANVENVWGGRPISKMLLQAPLSLNRDVTVSLIELIPPEHPDEYQIIYKMGLEHVGIVIGETFADFGKKYAQYFTGQQNQGPFCQPYFITFPDHSNVKLYEISLQDVCIREGKQFDGFYHVLRD